MPTTVPSLSARSFLTVPDFTAAELDACLSLAAQLKAERSLGRRAPTTDALLRHAGLR